MAVAVRLCALLPGLVLLVTSGCNAAATASDANSKVAAAGALAQPRSLPRLVDLGAGKCIPCKEMAPILEQLRKDYAGRLEVEFIDVWKDPDAGGRYGVRMIPTQIFYAADGKELARHEGFMAREQILAQWKALGVSL